MRASRKFLARLRSLDSPFTREQVQAQFPELQSSSVSVYLSHAKRAGLIEQIGLGRYRHEDPTRKEALPPSVSAVMKRVRAELLPSVLEQLIVWSDDSLAPFVHDGFAKPFVVIEGGAKAIEAVTRVVRDQRVTCVRNYDQLGRQIWAQDEPDHVFLLTTKRAEATVLLADGFRVPTLGRLLLPVLHMPALLPDTALNLLSDPTAHLGQTIDALPSRKATIRLGVFLGWLLNEAPDHRAVTQLDRLLPEGFARWRARS